MSEQYGPHSPAGGPNPGYPGWQPQGQPAWQPQGAPQPSYAAPGGPGYQQSGGYQQPEQGYGAYGRQSDQGYAQPGQPAGYQQAPEQGFGQPYQQPEQNWQGGPQWQGDQQWQGGQSGPGWTPQPPAKKSRTPIVITACAVVVALLAAAGVWFFAFRDTKPAGGASSPQEAANSMLTALSLKDPVGVADQLDPAEAALFSDMTGSILTELKRLQIVAPTATKEDLTGTTIKVEKLTYDPTPEQINDHLSIVKVTGGTITVTSDPSKIQLTDKVKAAFGDKIARMQPQTKTVDVAAEVAKRGEAFRLATVQRDGKWYPSVLYTLADNYTHEKGLGNPSAADVIPAAGGTSPEDTVNKLLTAITDGDAKAMIALLPPEEMGVLHDYGSLLLKDADYPGPTPTGVSFSNASWNVTDTDGGKVVSIKSLSVTTKDGQTVSIQRDGDTLTVTVPNKAPIVINEQTLNSLLDQTGSNLDQQAKDIIKREFKQALGIGLVVTQTDGKWYISPARSYVGVFTTLLKGLQPGDIDYLISLAKK